MKEFTEEMLKEAAELFTRVFQGEPWNEPWRVEQAEERLEDLYHLPKFLGMAEFDEKGNMIGIILGRGERHFSGLQVEILEFCVDSQLQGKGIGTKMLTAFLTYIKQKGYGGCFLITSHGEKTEGFYQKNGFLTAQEFCVMNHS